MAETCKNCGRTIVPVNSMMDMMRSNDAMLYNKAGCSTCGITVCFDCAAGAAEKVGRKGHCVCPGCGADLGKSGETTARITWG